ncbi:MAG: DUF6384 family protein [Isosphaeraceae bacterium]
MSESTNSGTLEAPSRDDRSSEISLPEMLRIMDVATALRKDRELVDLQLGVNEVKAKLRTRLIEAAKVTGEAVTVEEVEAAIDRYYQQLHTFREPRLSVPVALAHLYVRRWAIATWGGSILVAAWLCWWLFLSPTGRFTVTGRERQRLERLVGEVARHTERVRGLSTDSTANATLARLAREAEVLQSQGDLDRLAQVSAELADLEQRLREEYTVSVIAQPGKKSGIDRYFTDADGKRVSGYYLIVEAKTPQGEILSRRVHNAESGTEADVTVWAERVPKAVYDRLVADKKSDGILNETTYAIKRPGSFEEEVVMKDSDGSPLRRLGQITAW